MLRSDGIGKNFLLKATNAAGSNKTPHAVEFRKKKDTSRGSRSAKP
jgi:hypothetical protein